MMVEKKSAKISQLTGTGTSAVFGEGEGIWGLKKSIVWTR